MGVTFLVYGRTPKPINLLWGFTSKLRYNYGFLRVPQNQCIFVLWVFTGRLWCFDGKIMGFGVVPYIILKKTYCSHQNIEKNQQKLIQILFGMCGSQSGGMRRCLDPRK